MADEITITTGFQVSNGNLRLPKHGRTIKVDQTVAGEAGLIGVAPAAGVDVDTTALTSEGWTYIESMEGHGGTTISSSGLG